MATLLPTLENPTPMPTTSPHQGISNRRSKTKASHGPPEASASASRKSKRPSCPNTASTRSASQTPSTFSSTTTQPSQSAASKPKCCTYPATLPDHVGHQIGTAVFTGDCDFPGGSATALFHSMRTLRALRAHFRLYTGHDYPPGERGVPLPYTTVAEQNERNKHVKRGAVRAVEERARCRVR